MYIEAEHIIRMPLQPPKRTPEGFYMAIEPSLSSPTVRWNAVSGAWECSSDMIAWCAAQRTTLLGELISHGNWFSRPPRREMLETLFTPWIQGGLFVCPTPVAPGAIISAVWSFDGILMSSKVISPVWSILSVQEESATSDTISLFDEAEGREIQFDEIETVKQAAPTKLKSREWEARKFIGKERVREARLKAQIARKIAKKEESRYYEQFGDPDDDESRMSVFDLTDSESESATGSEMVSVIAE